MRPTVPLAEWRIAVDLDATRALLAAAPPPECGRTCPWCRNWEAAHVGAVAAPVGPGLRRLGLDVGRPADLYAYAEPDAPGAGYPTRVTFYVVGRVLSGPPAHTEDARVGLVRNYVPIRSPDAPRQSGLSVAHTRDVGGAPWPRAAQAESVLQVDLRIDVPWVLAEPAPPVCASAPSPRAS